MCEDLTRIVAMVHLLKALRPGALHPSPELCTNAVLGGITRDALRQSARCSFMSH